MIFFVSENEILKSKLNTQSHCTQPEKLNCVNETTNKSIRKPVITNNVVVNFPLSIFNNKQVPPKASEETATDTSIVDDDTQTINTQTIDDILNKGKKNDKENHLEEISQPSKKRTVEEILRDVDDLIGPINFGIH